MSEALRTASEEAPLLNLVAVLATLSNDLTPQQFSDYTQELAIVCISELPDDMGGTSIDKDALVEKLSIAILGSNPPRALAVYAVATAISASSFSFGLG